MDLWDKLRGAAPDATGAMSSEEFVRKLRDEWPNRQATLTAAQEAIDRRGPLTEEQIVKAGVDFLTDTRLGGK